MTTQAKSIRRCIYMLLAILVVLLPMTGWYARSVTTPRTTSPYPRSLRPYVACERLDPTRPLAQRCERLTAASMNPHEG